LHDFTAPVSRRAALHTLVGAGALAISVSACSSPDKLTAKTSASGPHHAPGLHEVPTPNIRMGPEWGGQKRTFMTWPATSEIWGDQLVAVRNDIKGLARAISGFQPVVLLARPDQADNAQRACGNEVEVVPIPVDDLWARDTVPVFVEASGRIAGVDFNFSGWGNKQNPHDLDHAVADAVLTRYAIPRVDTWIVAEGGSFETDGQGTLMVTESSVVNDNRNPGRSRQQIEDELKRVLGVQKVIWLAGVRGQDITDAHVDSLARFVAPGVVLLDRGFPGSDPDVWSRSSDQARTVLNDASDSFGHPLTIVELTQPDPAKITGAGKNFVSSYVNFTIADKAVFMPQFGDAAADDTAYQTLRDHFPGREIVPVKIDTIASGGGGIHCATHDQPALLGAG